MARPPSDSRGRLVSTARRLLRRQGYQATGIAQLVTDSGAPRGSVYFLFPGGKEELAVLAIEQSAAEFTDLIRTAAQAPDLKTFMSLIADHLAGELRESGYTDGCPISTVTLDATPASETLSRACADAYRTWTEALTSALIGFGVNTERAGDLAVLMLASVEGALLLARAQRSIRPLEIVHGQLEALAARATPG